MTDSMVGSHGYALNMYGTANVYAPDFSRFTTGLPLNLRFRPGVRSGQDVPFYEAVEAVGDVLRHNEPSKPYDALTLIQAMHQRYLAGTDGTSEAYRWFTEHAALHEELYGLVEAEVVLMVEDAAEGITVDWRDRRDRLESVLHILDLTDAGKPVAAAARAKVDAYRVDRVRFEPSDRLASATVRNIEHWWPCWHGHAPYSHATA
jgi:hypothetical protein